MSNSITFLGTGTSTGVPMIGCHCSVCSSKDPRDKRLRTSAFIEYEGFKILIDCGPDFRQQALNNGITDIDAILLTHQHKDHTGGLDDVRALNYLCKKPASIYCEERVLESLKKEFYYAFAENPYPGAPKFDIHIIDNQPFKIVKGDKSITVTPIRAMHYKLPVLAYRLGPLCYLTDANFIPDEEYKKLHGLEVFTISSVRRKKHISHFTLSEALEVIDKVRAKKSFITHFSHQTADDEKGIQGTYKALLKELPQGVKPAYDGLKVSFGSL